MVWFFAVKPQLSKPIVVYFWVWLVMLTSVQNKTWMNSQHLWTKLSKIDLVRAFNLKIILVLSLHFLLGSLKAFFDLSRPWPNILILFQIYCTETPHFHRQKLRNEQKSESSFIKCHLWRGFYSPTLLWM